MKFLLIICIWAAFDLLPTVCCAQDDQPKTRLRPIVEPRGSSPTKETVGVQHGAAYSLTELQSIASTHNPTLVQAHEQVAGQRATARQAGLYPNPTVGYIAEQIGERNSHTHNSAGETQGAFVRQEIVTAGKLRLSRDKYLARAKSAEAGASVQDLRVHNDVAIHYYRTLGAARRAQTQRELLRTSEDNLVTQRERFNVGQANEADVHEATAQLQEQRLRVEMVQNEEQQAWQELLAVVGTELPAHGLAGSLEEGAPKLAYQPTLDRVLAQSPELALARAQLRADEITLRREQAEPIPNVFVQGQAGENFPSGEPTYGTQVYVSVPIFDRNQGTIRQVRADLARQQAQVRLTELDLRSRFAATWQRYLTARQHVDDYRDVVLPQRESRYRTNLVSYKNDRETWVNVLASQGDYFHTKLMYTQQLVELREAQTLLEGMLLSGGLTPPPEVTPPGHVDSNPRAR